YSTSIAKEVKPVSFDNNCSSGMTSCKEVDCLSMEGFKMPINLTHKMTDNELFWRASLVPNKAEYPFERVPKVAFMFMTRGPLPFLKLWERFFKGQDVNKYSIYVHTNPGVRMNFSNSSVFYNRVIPSQDVRWGTVTLVDAERRLLGNALLDFSNERFVLLSESCIPIYNFPIIYNYLIGSTQSFLDSYDEPSRYGRGRYSRHMKPDIMLRDWRKGKKVKVFLVEVTRKGQVFDLDDVRWGTVTLVDAERRLLGTILSSNGTAYLLATQMSITCQHL
nr:glycosyl transferase, family 14 [Tanacetum cinerariifolium]